MPISYDEALKAQRAIEDSLLDDPNIVSVGVIEEVNELGEKTGSYAIKVGVISAEVYQHSLEHGQSLIPHEYQLHNESNAQEIKHVHIKVVKTGEIKSLSIDDKNLPSAIDMIPKTKAQTLDDNTARRRPSPCGQSIGHPTTTAGTMGLLVCYESGPNIGKAYILSNNHVLAANNMGFVGDHIIQPGRYDSGVVGIDTIASLYRWVPLDESGINYADAAIAEVTGATHWKLHVIPYVNKIGYPIATIHAQLGMAVEKTGRTTSHTQGTVLSITQTVKVNYGDKILRFKNQICTSSISKGGDSGAALFENGTKKVVGLLFAGDESETFHNPISNVLTSLSMHYTNKYPTGKTHVFFQDYPLTIVRNYSTVTVPLVNKSYKTNIKMSLPKPPLPSPISRSLFDFAAQGTRNTMKASASLPPVAKCAALLIGLGICATAVKKTRVATTDPHPRSLELNRK